MVQQTTSPQQMTESAHLGEFDTPTLTYGEVGETIMQALPGYANSFHGVGEFEYTEILERMVQMDTFLWSVSSVGRIININILDYLLSYPRNKVIIDQFRYIRADVEVTLRLNTNQFYYGALMVTLFPGQAATSGTSAIRVDERAVMDPTIISASCADSVVKDLAYSFPFPWMPRAFTGTGISGAHCSLVVDVLAPLTRANEDMPDSVVIQMWCRLKNVKLSRPYMQAQSSRLPKKQRGKGSCKCHVDVGEPYPMVRKKKKKPVKSPADDGAATSSKGAKKNTVEVAVNAITSIALEDAYSSGKQLASYVMANWSSIAAAAAFVLDKPDREVVQMPIINEPMIDAYAADLPDTNTSVGLYAGSYADPSPSRMPMSKNWTVSAYSQIPGLRNPAYVYTTGTSPQVIPIIVPTNAAYRTPLDFAYVSSVLWRGSVKVMLKFFTSAFISARFLIEYGDTFRYPNAYPTDYTAGISRIIDVKGDTTDYITLPWIEAMAWSVAPVPQIRVSLISNIATTDAALSPIIYMTVWVAGGDDIQFTFPRYPSTDEWEAQCSVGAEFQKKFVPIVPDCYADIDNGHSVSETLGSITDICKRYASLPPGGVAFPLNEFDIATWNDPPGQALYNDSRMTYVGSWRAAFMFRSGGLKYRYFAGSRMSVPFIVTNNIIGTQYFRDVNVDTGYTTGNDNIVRVTIPYMAQTPFVMLNLPSQMISISSQGITVDSSHPSYVAARDDFQLGFPILPQRLYNVD